MAKDELRARCLEKVAQEHEKYKKNFFACGMDILGEDGDTYAAVREAKEVVRDIIVSDDVTESQLDKILNAPNLIDRIGKRYAASPLTAFGKSREIAFQVIEGR